MALEPLSCKIGLHKWGRAHFIDHSIHSNILDWQQKCVRCEKRITWVQPKGISKKYYPIYWYKRTNWLFWLILLIIIIYLLNRHYTFLR